MNIELQQQIIEEAVRLAQQPKGPGVEELNGDDATAYAVMRIAEGHDDFEGCERAVTVGYGSDIHLYDDYGKGVDAECSEWWSRFEPVEGMRFRIFYEPHIDDEPPEMIEEIMGVIGATPVAIFENDDKDSYDHRGRYAAHYVLPRSGPIPQRVERRA